MHQKTKELQRRYEGFLQTQCLWKNDAVFGLMQFKINPKFAKIDKEIDEKLRLGKYVERLVSYQLAQEENVSILCENVQIQKEKETLGELDCILNKDQKPIHLEIIYKFYLYNEEVGTSEIEHFIGPNKKDALIEKLTKLKEKQLPLLYSKACENYLKNMNLISENISQQVYFKAQLFIPLAKKGIQFKYINTACISGFYINRKELSQFTDCKFYIPIKKDWLITPYTNVSWMNFNDFNIKVDAFFERKFSPLLWIKNENGIIEKYFLVWW